MTKNFKQSCIAIKIEMCKNLSNFLIRKLPICIWNCDFQSSKYGNNTLSISFSFCNLYWIELWQIWAQLQTQYIKSGCHNTFATQSRLFAMLPCRVNAALSCCSEHDAAGWLGSRPCCLVNLIKLRLHVVLVEADHIQLVVQRLDRLLKTLLHPTKLL